MGSESIFCFSWLDAYWSRKSTLTPFFHTILPMRLLLCLIALAVLVAGCGNKTPLVLPKPKPAEQATAPKPPPEQDGKKPATEP
jgi:predicted small lipoprotein YifL